MKILAKMIYRQLEERWPFVSIQENEKHMVRGVLFASDEYQKENYLYIMTDEEYLPSFYHMNHVSLLLLSENVPHNLNPANDILLFSPDTDREKLLNDIVGLFQDYQEWAEQVESCPEGYEGIRAMMDLSHRKLRASLILTDHNLQFLYYTRDFIQSGYLDAANHMLPSEETLRMLMTDENYEQATRRKEVFRFPENGDHEACLCYNLFADTGATQGRLMLLRSGSQYTEEDRFLLEYLGYRIARILRAYGIQAFPLDNYRQFRQMLTDILQEKLVPESKAEDLLRRMKWDLSGGYGMIALCSVKAESGISAPDRLRNQVERLFPGAFAVDRENEMFLIFSGQAEMEDHTIKALEDLCAQYRVAAGVGPRMETLAQAASCADLCVALTEIGRSSGAASSVSRYTDYMLEYLLQYDTRRISRNLLCHPAVLALARYDRTHATAYVKTLRVYLEENQSPTHTARRLFIHRSTLLERIERMRSLMGACDLTDWRTRLCVALSLEIIETEETADKRDIRDRGQTLVSRQERHKRQGTDPCLPPRET